MGDGRVSNGGLSYVMGDGAGRDGKDPPFELSAVKVCLDELKKGSGGEAGRAVGVRWSAVGPASEVGSVKDLS